MTSKFISRLKSKEGKLLIENFKYLTILQIVGYVFPIITIPYLARTIGTIGYGKIAFATAIIAYFQSIVTWGFDYTATRDVAKVRENKLKVSVIFSKIISTRIFLTALSLFIIFILIQIIPQFKENEIIIYFTFIQIIGHVMFPEWLFQAYQKLKYTTILNFCTKCLFTSMIFIFINNKSDYILYPLFISCGYIISGLISLHIIFKSWGIKFRLVSIRMILKTLKDGSSVFINNFAPNLYNSFSSVLLGQYWGNSANGILDAGQRFVNLSEQFFSILSRTFFPYLSRNINKHYLYSRLTLILGVLVSLGLFFGSEYLIKLFYTEEFYDAIFIMKILSFSILFNSIRNVYGVNFLILKNLDSSLRTITLISSIIGFIIALLIVPHYSYVGVAIVLISTRFLNSILILIKAFKVKSTEKNEYHK